MPYIQSTGTVPQLYEGETVSNWVFYAQSTSTVKSGRFCVEHILSVTDCLNQSRALCLVAILIALSNLVSQEVQTLCR